MDEEPAMVASPVALAPPLLLGRQLTCTVNVCDTGTALVESKWPVHSVRTAPRQRAEYPIVSATVVGAVTRLSTTICNGFVAQRRIYQFLCRSRKGREELHSYRRGMCAV